MTLEKIDNVRDVQKALKGKESRLRGIDDFEEFSKIIEAKKMSKARYARVYAPSKEIMRSNGETALDYYQHAFEGNGIFLLDEPENCLSPIFQIELIKIIEEASRYFDCQFFICTHSPFILSLNNAIIYNLDLEPVMPKNGKNSEM